MEEGVRIDKWLWAVRLFKTRSQATDACKSGKIKIDGKTVKASREVKIGETISFNKDHITRTVKVKELLKNRVGAKLVEIYLEDLTPDEEYNKQKLVNIRNFEFRGRGIGRPTKRDRRDIEKLKDI
ncbi:MAG: RNA-binding S4 domain-containing protein [Saprospiraceae bacterium]|nr:RNA-binding S4 domain-containing protein [Saprospiraceae bacterium]